MRLVVQRVKEARVEVEQHTVGQIDHGLLVFAGITHNDDERAADFLARKLCQLRIFEDDKGKMNHDVQQQGGAILAVSQFTLYADCKKGNRPSFIEAASPEQAAPLFNYFVEQLRLAKCHVETGSFGAEMKVSLLNDGPVTIILESPEA